MRGNESLYPSDWQRLAERDWDRVERNLREGDPELAAFCLQQAVEKFLKAFLLTHNWSLRRIHDLETLLDDAVTYEPDFEQCRQACIDVADYYMVERYPLMVSASISVDDVQVSREAVRPLIEKRGAVLQSPNQKEGDTP